MPEPKALKLGAKKSAAVTSTGVQASTPRKPPVARRPVTRRSIRRSSYYSRGGNYYYHDDNSLVEDILTIALLTELFDNNVEDFAELGAAQSQQDVYEPPIVEEPVSTADQFRSSNEPEPADDWSSSSSSNDWSSSSDSGSYSSDSSDSGGSYD